jgi:hypothetical protein
LGRKASTVPRSSVAKWPDIGATINSRGCGRRGGRSNTRSK